MAAEAHVEVDFQHRIGNLEMSVAFRTSAPWTVLFGASGSGKSTILRVLAGLERPDHGKVSVRGTVVSDSGAGVWVPPYERPVRWAGQRAYLTPGRRVRQQILEGMGSRELQADADGLLERFGLKAIAEKRPEELSGGERQRVSVVRAAAGARGRVLLLDEPFAGLDAAVRDRLIENLRSWLGDTPIVSVTHDVGEAFLLGAEVIRVSEGRVVAQGPVAEVLAEERRRLAGVLG
jgi:molybdate transport system ATP-binding protein